MFLCSKVYFVKSIGLLNSKLLIVNLGNGGMQSCWLTNANLLFIPLIYRNDTKEDVFVHQVSEVEQLCMESC